MKIISGQTYRILVAFPWGEKKELLSAGLTRHGDGSITWPPCGDFQLSPLLDSVVRETDEYVIGFVGGTCDTTGAVSHADCQLDLAQLLSSGRSL